MAGKEKHPNWGGNRKSEWSFRLTTKTVNIPPEYHQQCKDYAKQLEDADVETGKLYQDESGKWVYRE